MSEVQLRDCNGDLDWQESMVRAIERASPLPAPPDVRVFSDSLRMTFQSAAYQAEGPQDGFVPLTLSSRNSL